MKRTTNVFVDTLKQFAIVIAVVILITAINAVVFWLYNVIFEPFIYSVVLGFAVVLILFIIKFAINLKKASEREHISKSNEGEWSNNLMPETLAEQDYCEMLNGVLRKLSEYDIEVESERQEMLDYYTSWVHQIKTPISVMRLQLKSEDTEKNRDLLVELFRIERYVDMVLQYIRLDSKSNDLVITQYPLDEIIRESIRKYASQFIASKVRLEYNGTDKEVVTDRKWLSCIIEQLLSNAVKYAPEGKVIIEVTDDLKLHVKDNGIGISPEDLPRVFEKGYTGYRGREDKHASGIGLFLCKKICDNLGVTIWAESKVGEGTTIFLDLSQKKDVLE